MRSETGFVRQKHISKQKAVEEHNRDQENQTSKRVYVEDLDFLISKL